MSRSTGITKTTISRTVHDLVIACWRWNFSRLSGHNDKIEERTRGSRLNNNYQTHAPQAGILRVKIISLITACKSIKNISCKV